MKYCIILLLVAAKGYAQDYEYIDEPQPSQAATSQRDIQIQQNSRPAPRPSQFQEETNNQPAIRNFPALQPAPKRPSSHRLDLNSKSGTFQCPEPNGLFEDPHQCDKYYQCENFKPLERLCEDGLVFDISKGNAGHQDPCDSPYVVDCSERQALQPPSYTNDFCPRYHGTFADPDETICDVYFTCIKGQYSKTDCATGLHFDEKTGLCTWPAEAGRAGCRKPQKKTTASGFSCPSEEVINDQGMTIPHPTYANNDDCALFYVCLNGETPQEASCSLGEVYNTHSGQCDFPENVPECANYYENYDPNYYDDALANDV